MDDDYKDCLSDSLTRFKEFASECSLDEALVSQHQARVVQEKQRPIGAILVEKGYLNVKQVARLLGLQADEPHMLLGELAVREGFCEPEEVAYARRRQRELLLGVKQSAIDENDPAEVQRLNAVLAYAKFLERELYRLRSEGRAEAEAEKPESVSEAV